MSEYLNWKFRDVKPDGPAPALTPRQKLANWWHYSKWFVLGGGSLAGPGRRPGRQRFGRRPDAA